MIEFKKNVKKSLPYDRKQYLDFLDEDINSTTKWYGVSFQLPGGYEGREIGLTEYLEAYAEWFKAIISQLDKGSFWTVNHDGKDMNWLPNDENNLVPLRALFKQNHISNEFKGALLFTKDDLLKFAKELISYPLAVFNEAGYLYENLDVSHSELSFIIKISGHANIDLLSTDQELLTAVINANNSNSFILRPYRGTFL
ncbi:hypothetical protein VRU48_15550 [Pedobacter sp. KR3-3]|uniref:Uncharacterized protein n=1 Tax=Pedobacter albus TaxID=3113905 RepID=A0ABU7IAM8_9SPHI|nr:hypothetical protein [Pedobacter sp. KR3-3]MEE1946540.1 hypothetical protein [Pedobacter sp. KR3-3]